MAVPLLQPGRALPVELGKAGDPVAHMRSPNVAGHNEGPSTTASLLPAPRAALTFPAEGAEGCEGAELGAAARPCPSAWEAPGRP